MPDKANIKALERRGHLRLLAPIKISYLSPSTGKTVTAAIKNISADGLAFETGDKSLKESDIVELKLDLPEAANPVHSKGRVVWKRRQSLSDNAPFDVGLEFAEIEEDNKNTFLKFLCDQIYALSKELRNAKNKS